MTDFDARFGALARLFGIAGLERLKSASVMVVGIGGVGSWAAEALARSGIGCIHLVDLDDVCLSNVNRQLHATNSAIGRPKVEVMAERIGSIAPETRLHTEQRFFTATSAPGLLVHKLSLVVDAIDDVANKCLLLASCRDRGLTVVTCGGAGGRRDPTQIRTEDLAETHGDPLAAQVRKRLRREYGFPAAKGARFGIRCVFSAERPVFPSSDGGVCDRKTTQMGALRLNCDQGYGTASFVTGAFGLAMAAEAVSLLVGESQAMANSNRE